MNDKPPIEEFRDAIEKFQRGEKEPEERRKRDRRLSYSSDRRQRGERRGMS